MRRADRETVFKFTGHIVMIEDLLNTSWLTTDRVVHDARDGRKLLGNDQNGEVRVNSPVWQHGCTAAVHEH